MQDTWDPVAAAEQAAPLARERAAEAETGRRLPADLVAALTEAGLFRLFVPRAYGGPAVEPLAGLEAIETVARADGAAGWCVNIASTTATMSWYLEPTWAATIYGDPAVVTGGAFAPTGRARRTEGGFVLEAGRWAWGSGTQHCQWINCGVLTDERAFHLMYVPADEVEFHDTWYSSGLRGTGSLDFEVRDRFVPTGRELQPGVTHAKVDEPLCRFPNFSLLAAGLCSVTLGIGRRAVDELAALATGRTPMLAQKTLAQQGYVQVDLARASAAIGAARSYLFDQVGRAWRPGDCRRPHRPPPAGGDPPGLPPRRLRGGPGRRPGLHRRRWGRRLRRQPPPALPAGHPRRHPARDALAPHAGDVRQGPPRPRGRHHARLSRYRRRAPGTGGPTMRRP